MLVHPSDRYVGSRVSKKFFRPGGSLAVDWVVSDLEGAPRSDVAVEVRLARLEIESRGREVAEKEVEVERCTEKRSAAASRCTFRPMESGRYRVTAVSTDAEGRKNQSALDVWVVGRWGPHRGDLDADQVIVIPEKRSICRERWRRFFLVLAPYAPAEGLLTVRRHGVVHLERFSMKEESTTAPGQAG